MSGTLIQFFWIYNIHAEAHSEKLDRGYNGPMDTDTKKRLAWTGDLGNAACAIRLRAARTLTGMNQKELASAIGLKYATNLNNMENGIGLPNRQVMQFLFEEYRIDFNFLMAGLYAQLPGDVQDLLFPALEVANSEWDQKVRSDRDRSKQQI